MVRKKTPEEIAREREADAYIQQREQYASRASQNGNISVKAARKQFNQQAAATEDTAQQQAKLAGEPIPQQTFSGKTVTMEQAQEAAEQEKLRQKENVEVAEEAGVFENRPEKLELDVSKEEKEVLERREKEEKRIAKVEKFLGSSRENAMKILGIEQEDIELEDLIENPETARQQLLQEIQREELDRFRTNSQKVGTKLEPWVGDLKVIDIDIGGYANKLSRMPKQEAEEIVAALKETEGIISGMTDAAAQGELGNPNEVLRDIADYEEDIYRLEARLKVLILSSVELRANPEKVNEIEVAIQSAKETTFEAKQRAAEGSLVTPTNEQLYFKLKRIKEEANK